MGLNSWTDHGSIGIRSSSSKPYNAIDGNLFNDGGKYYMNFGSFWHDIYQAPMGSAATTISSSAHNIAYNPSGTHAVEGAFMYKHASGQEYKIKVCRSTSATGNFIDKNGVACTNGGGTVVLESHGTVYGPGGQGVFTDPTLGPVLYYHYVDTRIGYADGQKLFGWNVIDFSSGWPVGFAALGLIAEISPVERSFDLSESPARDSFSLPSMPSEFDWVEFDWVCEPPPSSKAITQGRTFEDCDHDLAVMFPLKQSGHPQQRGDDESSPEAAQDPSHDLRAGSSPEHSLEHSRESPSQSRPDLTGEAIQPPRRPARFFYGTDSEDVSSDDNEWSTAEDFQEDTEDEESSSDSGSDTSWDGPRRGVNICIYRDPTLSPPDEFYNRGRPLPYAPRPVRDYGSQSLRGPEWEDLDREPLGIQFWRSMSGDPPAGPAKYMQFHPYARYGFAFWEEQRMMQLGLWSHQALDDPVEYYRRWYTFLSQEDRSRTYGI
ncbi:probable arabinan endo-1,5-alpha-L-arabinosidase A [Aspergillus lentulus]|uniref:Endo-1,5-alpha-L-arabinanase A n=1 Tax=Aspergillus lentulus TaxID=293939 RepID=A0AAN4PTI9_ASPLE|nr:probable arabinan endo-1,5-alpha-L-arabinosidase A [Aspergillus lentulus]